MLDFFMIGVGTTVD